MTGPGAVAKHARPSPNPRSRMSDADLARTIDAAWEDRAKVDAGTKGAVREAVEESLQLLDDGRARVAEKDGASWRVNQWLKKAVLLSFRLNDMGVIEGGPGGAAWWDKVASKFEGWGENRFRAAGFRAVPGAIVRRGAYVAPNVVLMPSFVNLGAYVGEGSVLSMGVFISASTKIVDRETGETFSGRVPPYSVVVPGSLPGKALPDGSPGPSLYCAVIVKRVDEQTRAKTSINELLRD